MRVLTAAAVSSLGARLVRLAAPLAGPQPARALVESRRPTEGRRQEAAKLHKLIEPHGEALITRLADIAKGSGNEVVKACEILVSYLCAKPRPTAELVLAAYRQQSEK